MDEELVLAVPPSVAPISTIYALDRKYKAVDAAVLDGQSVVMLICYASNNSESSYTDSDKGFPVFRRRRW